MHVCIMWLTYLVLVVILSIIMAIFRAKGDFVLEAVLVSVATSMSELGLRILIIIVI